jgi:hypothetical protein
MKYCLLSLYLFFIAYQTAVAQGVQVEFGKNRVQYHKDFAEWSEYESQNFHTYWYGQSRYVGQAAVQLAELDYEYIQSLMEYRMTDKIEIIAYTDLTDLHQSNIGNEELLNNPAGQTKIAGNKVFVYFDGNHQHLRQQIKEGVAKVCLQSMLYGLNFQEIVQSVVAINLPEWFGLGLVAYVGEEWSVGTDAKLRDIFKHHPYKDFKTFAEKEPKLAGQSMWYFLKQQYGRAAVANLLYLARINRNVDSGFLYVIGQSYKQTMQDWQQYFEARYEQEEKSFVKIEKKGEIAIHNPRKLPISQLKLSPDGKNLAYIINEIGRSKVYIQNTHTKKERVLVLKNGYRNAIQATDYNYPLLAWNQNNNELSVLYEFRDNIRLMQYDLKTQKSETTKFNTQFQRINSIDYITNNDFVFSATVNGVSDLFVYHLKNNQNERLTDDFYDDLDATYVNNGNYKGILFASNRRDSLLAKVSMDTILPIRNFDIYFYDMSGEKKPKELVALTHTPHANERQPYISDSTYLTFLSDENGIINRKIGRIETYTHHYEKVVRLKDASEVIFHRDSLVKNVDTLYIDTVFVRAVEKKRGVVFNNTNYSTNIVGHHAAPRSGKWVESMIDNKIQRVFLSNRDTIEQNTQPLTRHQEQYLKGFYGAAILKSLQTTKIPQKTNAPLATNEPPPPVIEKKDTIPVKKINPDYLFQTEFETPPVAASPEKTPDITDIVKEQLGKSTLPALQGITLEHLPNVSIDDPKVVKFRPARITPHRLKVRTDFVTSQMDNTPLFGGLNSFAGQPQGFETPPAGFLMKANFKDLLEDYELEMGARYPTSFNGSEYFLQFKDKKTRLDKHYGLYRHSVGYTDPIPGNVSRRRQAITTMAVGEIRYPLDVFTSIRGTLSLRNDRLATLVTDKKSLNIPIDAQQRIGLKAEYVFDNTLDVGLNIKNGTRYKGYVEVVKKFQVQFLDKLEFNANKGFMTIIGGDARHYERVLRHSVLALRVAGATSLGSEKILYFLGGTDNWLLPRFNNDIPQPQGTSFAYQTLAANLRGFTRNIRNGNSFVLGNAELRVPIMKYLTTQPVQSTFWRNMQVVGFFDFGTAWSGVSPFTDDNPINTVYVSSPPTVFVKVKYFRDPIVAGYGAGLRTSLFGYFLRADYAWGIETKVVQKPILYVSMGMDF